MLTKMTYGLCRDCLIAASSLGWPTLVRITCSQNVVTLPDRR
jgi:hypothetical protein